MNERSAGAGIHGFAELCADCEACRDACPFLAQQGSPGEIIRTRPGEAFLCTNCGACDPYCPAELSPSQALHAAKARLIGEGQVPEPVTKALAGARGFVASGHRFPFRYYGSSSTLFWPGCGLAGTSPEIVGKTRDLLRRRLKEPVGLALDCCGDPVFQFGDTEEGNKTLLGIAAALRRSAVKRIITGCVNCQKILAPALDDVEVTHVLAVVSDAPHIISATEWVYLHHPCRASAMGEMRKGAKNLLAGHGRPVGESPSPMCCGNGGGLAKSDPGLANKFVERILQSAEDRPIVTYCMGCAGRLRERGARTHHVLELVTGSKEPSRIPGFLGGWWARGLLASIERLKSPKILLAFLLVALIGALLYLRWAGYFSLDEILGFLRSHSLLAPAIFLTVYGIAPALLLPAIPLSLAAGFLWGPVWGVVLSAVGATMGACLSFFVARYILGDAVRRRFGEEKWEALTKIVEKHGWKAVAISRLVPIFPFNMLNYFFGITPVPFSHYLWCTFVFMLPGCVAFVAFGSSLGDIARGNVKGLLIGLGIAAVAFVVPLAFKPLLKKIMDEQPDTKGKG